MYCFIESRVWRRMAAALCLSLTSYAVNAEPLSLNRAWAMAELANPTLRVARANLAAAQGELKDAKAFLWNNPQPFAEYVRRQTPQPGLSDVRTRDVRIGVSQTFETAGQQGLRREAAEKNLAAIQFAIEDTRRQIRLEVAQSFFRVLSLQMRVATEQEALRLFEEASAAVGKRVAAGEDTRLDGNIAKVEATRAQNQLAQLGEQLIRARGELAALLQLPPGAPVELVDSLESTQPHGDLDTLLANLDRRPDIVAAALRIQTATARLQLERAVVSPDITVGVSYGKEGSAYRDAQLIGVNVSLPIPIFRRNGTGIGRAATDRAQRQIDALALDRNAHADVRALWSQMESLRDRVNRLKAVSLPLLQENQRLSSVAFREGEIGLLQLILVNRQLLDGRRDLLEARTDLRLIEVALDAASSVSPLSLASGHMQLENGSIHE